jgi:ATP-dependent Clp protease ATP-binding subunit ClpA
VLEFFTETARAILVEAQDLARELGSSEIGVGHLLHGCAEVRTETAAALREAGITPAAIRPLLPRTDERPAAGVDPDALRAVGIDYEQVRAIVEQTFGAGALESAPDRRAPSGTDRRPPFTPEAKRTLELALRVASELHNKRILSAHLALALLRLDNELVSQVLDQAGVTPAALSAAILVRITDAA